ncbi:hypothetical protein KEM54_003325 [Ascosphaera aggregata]|nr:hypothetical protein KEM54_003325 [Ascosphaera aggregata]
MSAASRLSPSEEFSRVSSLHTSHDGNPSTPKQQLEPALQMPPVPRHTSLRLRRARFDVSAASNKMFETPHVFDSQRSSASLITRSQRPTPGTLSTLRSPQTPQAQVGQSTSRTPILHDLTMSDVDRDEGPESVRSTASNSSVNSHHSKHMSVSEDCATPESEMVDPFPVVLYQYSDPKDYLETPSKPERHATSTPAAPRAKIVKWTRDMDNHLWATYNEFLQDPTLTPFKMLPGTVPPLGVSYRVARAARKTWPKYKPQWGPSQRKIPVDACGHLRHTKIGGNKTPSVAGTIPTAKPAWPKSDASTRRRLKELCRRKYSIAPHYQRLIRSPSPKPETATSDTTGLDADLIRTDGEPLFTEAPASSSPFGTRDLGISLIAGGTSLEPRQPPVGETGEPVSENWFNELNMQNPETVNTDETVVPSSQLALGEGSVSGKEIPRLGSPFLYSNSGPNGATQGPLPPAKYMRSGPEGRLRPNCLESAVSNRPGHLGGLNNPTTQGISARSSFSESFRFQRGRWNPPRPHQRPPTGNDQSATVGIPDSQTKLKQLFTPSSTSGSASIPSLGDNSVLNRSSPPLPSLQGGDISRLGSPFQLAGSSTSASHIRRQSSVPRNEYKSSRRNIEHYHDGSSSTVRDTSHRNAPEDS